LVEIYQAHDKKHKLISDRDRKTLKDYSIIDSVELRWGTETMTSPIGASKAMAKASCRRRRIFCSEGSFKYVELRRIILKQPLKAG